MSNLQQKLNSSRSLFTLAVGIKRKEKVDKMVQKFVESNFAVMLFHYDGVVDGRKDLEWCSSVIHISALNQTKWWFAKRFLHPDIVADYEYVFLRDEDIRVEHFSPDRMKGLRYINQHLMFPNQRCIIKLLHLGDQVHRRMYKPGGKGNGCDDASTAPPCTGWIEVMAPVFSRAAWSCVWYLIQVLPFPSKVITEKY